MPKEQFRIGNIRKKLRSNINLYQKEVDRVDVKELWSVKELKDHPMRSLRIMRNIHPRPEARAHRNGRPSRPAEGWKGTFKKVLDSAEALR